jgi:hypothetical protein
LVGDDHGRLKVIGPFPDAERAQAYCNLLGLPEIQWCVLPLMDPT